MKHDAAMPRIPSIFVALLLPLCSALCQEPYRVGPGDVLDVQVFRHPERSVQVSVRPDGRISHPVLGEMDVEGKTIAQLTDIFVKALSKDLRAPNVVINVSQRKPRFVFILGEVVSAGALDAPPEGLTVKDALAQAGGPAETADTSAAELHRAGEPPVSIDLDREMASGPEEATWLHEGDILIVEPLLQGYVGIVGTAGPAARVPFETGDDLLTLLSKAGGAPPEADLQHSLILREDGRRETVDLEAIQEGRWEGPLPEIGPGDFVVLPVLPPQPFVTVLGEVPQPQRLPIDRKIGLKLSEVLAACSPFPDEADAHNARIIHADGTVTAVDLKDLVDGTGDQSLLDMEMQSFDVVHVPRQFSKVAAIGEFPRPGVYPLERGDRVLDLIKTAGGFQSRAGEKRFALLIRRSEDESQPQTQRIDLAALIRGETEEQNVALAPEDILFLPGPKAKWYEQVSRFLSPLFSIESLRSLLFGYGRRGLIGGD